MRGRAQYCTHMRSRRLPSRLWSILVIVAMLWSQAVYAFHAGCLPAPAATAATAATHAAMAMAIAGHTPEPALHRTRAHTCEGGSTRQQDPACAAHCATPASSTDVARIPPLPVVLPDTAPLFERLVRIDATAMHVALDYHAPRVRPRGPTGHPTPLLLI